MNTGLNSMAICDYFAKLKGLSAWGLVRSVGSIFFLELGKPIPMEGQAGPRGEWQFLVQYCNWRFSHKETIIIGSADDADRIDKAFAAMELGELVSAEVSLPLCDLGLLFSSGVQFKTLATSATYAAGEGTYQWMLFCPDDNVWSIQAGGQPEFGNVHA
jgi:hypothetical protein